MLLLPGALPQKRGGVEKEDIRMKTGLNIVLLEPEIPQNTGNIARTCAATGASLHLVGPMGFQIDDKKLKRAGLDYWNLLDITYYQDTTQFFEQNQDGIFYYATTKAPQTYCDVCYPKDVYLVFGKETAGIDERILVQNQPFCIRIPMIDNARSLNLSNAVAVAAYEVLRQNGFSYLKQHGQLTKFQWKEG